MGIVFNLEHANVVAYLTLPNQIEPPRIKSDMLKGFLRSLKNKNSNTPNVELYSKVGDDLKIKGGVSW